jgi:hypothetical protein
MQCWIYGPATDGIDDKINPPAADHYSIFRVNSEAPKTSMFSVGCSNSETYIYCLCPGAFVAILSGLSGLGN